MSSLTQRASVVPANLVSLKDGKPITTSQIVAESFGKNHRDVLRSITTITESPAYLERNQRNFALVDYLDAKGERRPMYEMDRQGFEILAMGFTGEKALRWKFKYSDAFAAMEAELRNPTLIRQRPELTGAQWKVISDLIHTIARRLGSSQGRAAQALHESIRTTYGLRRSRDLPRQHYREVCIELDTLRVLADWYANRHTALENVFIQNVLRPSINERRSWSWALLTMYKQQLDLEM